jgi:hypothetical protein
MSIEELCGRLVAEEEHYNLWVPTCLLLTEEWVS